MIHVHRWESISIASRRSHVEAWRSGITVGDIAGDGPCHVLLNGAGCELTDEVSDFDHVDVMPQLGTPVHLALIVLSFAVSWAVQKILVKPPPASERGDERSSTYGFNRMKNIRVEGQPIQVVYGEHRTAGTIINEFLEVDNATGASTYFALICVGQGTVESIGGETVDTPSLVPLEGDNVPTTIYINDNSISNFAKVRAWVRLGSNEQEFIPGFDKAKVLNEVDSELRQIEGDPTIPVITINDYGNGVAYEDIWDEWGFGYDTANTEVDGLEIVINFPQGLYTNDSGGKAVTTPWMLAIRWCRLDDSGTPILGPGTGGNANDGWVREPIEQFDLRRQNPFQLSFPISFYNPLDHADPVPGDAWYSSSWTPATNYFRTLDTVPAGRVPADWDSNGYASEFSFETWVAFEDDGLGPFQIGNLTGTDDVPLYEWLGASTSTQGVYFGFRVALGGGNEWFPYMRVGKWNSDHYWPSVDISSTATGGAEKNWYHVLFSHKRINASSNRTDLWINGSWLGAQYGNTDIIIPGHTGGGEAAGRMKFGYANGIVTGDFGIKGWWDQTIVWARAFGHPAAAARYNGGKGQTVTGANPDIVLSYSFDGSTFVDASSYGNHGAEVGAGGSFAVGEGVVSTNILPERLRSSYRVQVMRANEEINEAADKAPTIDQAYWQFAITWLDEAFVYPSAALYGVKVGATEQMNSSAPDITAVVKGRQVLVWDGASTASPRFDRVWSKNPIWISIDVATDTTYGGGHIFKLENVDLASAKVAADIADAGVYDGRAQREFYRQRWDEGTNWIDYPANLSAASSGGYWTESNVTVVDDAFAAPDGSITADTITDTSAVGIGSLAFSGTTVVLGRDPTWYSISLFARKDATATTHSASILIQLDGKTQTFDGSGGYTAIWNLDDGLAVKGCTVEDYNDDWWLVKLIPLYSGLDQATNSGGTNADVTFRLHPSSHTYGTETSDIALQGDITAWGVMLNLGQAHVIHPPEVEQSARLFMGDKKASGLAQSPPEHWVEGAEIRIGTANDSSWVTPASGPGLTITSIDTTGPRDGYRRTWIIYCTWYSSDATDAPDGTFENQTVDAWDWVNLAWHWPAIGGATRTTVTDTAGSGSGSTSPLESDVVEITGDAAAGIEQDITTSLDVGATVRMRALMTVDSGATDGNITITDSVTGTVSDSHTLTDLVWEALEVDIVVGGSVQFSINYTGTSGTLIWADAVGAYYSVDVNGKVPGGTIEGAEALFEYDAVHDTFRDIWTTIQEICLTARANPVREGNQLRFKIDYARDPVGMIGMASTVLEGEDRSTFTMRYANKRQRSNSYSIDFTDRDQLWDRSTAEKHSDELDSSSSGDVRQETFFLKGVTRRSQVIRHMKYLLLQNELLTRDGTLSAGPGTMVYEPGDVVEIGHDLNTWGQSGRCSENSASNALNLIAADFDSFDNWAMTSGDVDVTANVMPNDIGDPNADKVETLSASEVTLVKTVTGILNSVSYVFSVKMKGRIPPDNTGIQIAQSGGQTVLAAFTWATSTLSIASGPSGANLTVTALADGWYRVGVEIVSQNTNDFTVTITPARGSNLNGKVIYLADAQLEHDADTPTAYQRPGLGIYVDRDITLDALASGVTYLCRVTSTATGVSATSTVTAATGSYSPGDLVTIDTTTLGFPPQRGDEYIIYTAAQRMKAQLLSLGIGEDGSVACEWVQHDDAVFAGDTLDENEVVSSFSTNNGGPKANAAWGYEIPDDVVSVDAYDVPVSGPGGAMGSAMTVGWVAADQGVPISEYRVYLSFYNSTRLAFGPLELAGTSPAGTTSVTVPMTWATRGDRVRVAVQPISVNGARSQPDDCGGVLVVLGALAKKPEVPTGFMAHMESDQIAFTWTAPANAEGLTYEIRHGSLTDLEGGWVLAQTVGVTTKTKLGPTHWFASAIGAGADVTKIHYMLRARNRHGVYSNVVTATYGARVLNATTLTSSNHWYAYATQAWHSYADGWITDSGPPAHDPVAFNLSRHADGYLTFSSAKQATYITADLPVAQTPGHFEREAPVRIEAVLFATCRNPTVIGEGNANTDGSTKRDSTPPREQITYIYGGNETLEGNLQGDLPTVKVQMKLIRDGDSGVLVSTDLDSDGASGWIDYAPGVYQAHGAQFRLKVTRPTTDWDVRIYKFWTQTQRVLDPLHYRTPAERVFAQELGLG